MSPEDITRGYEKHVGSKPLLDTAAIGAGAAGATYLASKPLLNALRTVLRTAAPASVQGAADRWLTDGGMDSARRRLTLLALLAGMGYGAYKHGDWKGGMDRFLASMKDKNYWPNNPDRAAAYGAGPAGPSELEQATEMKEAALDGSRDLIPGYYLKLVPVPAVTTMVREDPVLFEQNKDRLIRVVDHSGWHGKTNGLSITDTAIKAGVGFGSAYAFGNIVGRMLAMPPPLRDRLSLLGGLGTAVVASGILKELP